MNYFYPSAKSSAIFLSEKNVKQILLSKVSLSFLLSLFLLLGTLNNLRAENTGSASCDEPTITCPEDNYGLDDGCNVEAPPAATTFNVEGEPNPDPALPTVDDGCGDLELTHEDLHSESDCVHILKRIYTITDEEDDYASCTQIFTWRVDEEGPTYDEPLPGDLTLECDQPIPDAPMPTATDNCVPPDILFINEIHYDNEGSDVNEFIEIAGQAGIDLSDYTLYAYEEFDGMYDDDVELTGIIPDEGDGWGAVAFDKDYLGSKFFENGKSGLALVKTDDDFVTEFISYEGVVIATNGPAKGCTSKLIGVEEGATPEDESIQRVGTACEACDFPWIEPEENDPGAALATPGYINANQTFDDDQCPELPITYTYNQEITPGDCPQEKTITRTWTATDVCDNTTTHVQVITIEDTTPPVPPAPPADVTVQCAADVPAPEVLTAPDNCGDDATGVPSAVITPGSCPNQFVMVRTYTFTDECGNSSSISHTITVNDDTPPVPPAPPADVNVQCAEDVPPPVDLTAVDNCDGDITVSPSAVITPGNCPNQFVMVRTWTFVDGCGNTSSVSQTITVDDTTPPTFTVPADVTIECIDDPDDLTITGDVMDAMDNCAATASVWINEFHYDNSGTDVGEFIELAGAAGTDLSTYQLVLYNGANGLVYNTNNLSGTIPDEGAGFGAIHFDYPTNGIQNGSPDGIALVESGTVLEFISYEGSFTAVNGPAAGMTSTDIGVSESFTTPVGFSLQLTGFGATGGDFTWIPPSPESPGLINDAQSIYLLIEYEDESDVTTCDGGTILRTWTVTDICGNAASDVQTIIVNPPAAPEITCPADMTVECLADIDVNFDDATVVTDCNLGFTGYVSQPDVMGAQNCPGTTYTYTYNVIDDCGRTNNCQQIFTIENDPPTIEVIPGVTVQCFEDIVTDPSDATVTTACGDDFELKILPPVVEGIFDCPGTTYTFTYRVRDNCDREVTADRVFTVGNNAPPTIVAPPDMTVTCAFNINVNPNYAEVTTGCTLGYVTTVSDPVISGTADCPGTTYTYTYTVTDDCGRQASDVRVFTIQNGPPIIDCPENCLVQNCEDGMYLEIINAWLNKVTATSSCGDEIVVNNNYNPNSLGFCIGDNTPVTFTATDNCGRTSSCTAMIIIHDTEAPTIIEPAQDMLTLCNANTQSVLDQWVDNYGGAIVEDGCWGDNINWSTNPANPTINCMGMMGNVSIDVTFTATDGCGNSISTTATFTALMGTIDVIIHGGLQTEEGGKVEGAEVMLDGNSAGLPATQMSDVEGNFEFGNLTLGSNYVVTPGKNDDPLNGLSTFDIVLMTKHILASELLDSPYKIIAADINKSGTVSTIDILKLRRLILFIDTEFQDNTSWRFVDAEFVFPDPTDPFATSFPEVFSINGLEESELANFVAVKIGDLNGSAVTNSFINGEDRNTIGELTFELNDLQLEVGEQYEIPFRSSDFNGMLGYQFTLNFNADVLDFNQTEAGSLTKLDDSNFGLTMIDEGVITTSWSNNVSIDVESDEVLFTLRFTATADAKLSEVLRISSQYTKSEAYNKNGMLDIELNFNVDGKVQDALFALYQNQPNPFKNETVIGFNLPESGTAKMKFFDVTGKLLKEIEGSYSEGYNEISITRADLPTAGVLYYQLETESNSATKKMILMTLR